MTGSTPWWKKAAFPLTSVNYFGLADNFGFSDTNPAFQPNKSVNIKEFISNENNFIPTNIAPSDRNVIDSLLVDANFRYIGANSTDGSGAGSSLDVSAGRVVVMDNGVVNMLSLIHI